MVDPDDELVFVLHQRIRDVQRLARGLSQPATAYERVLDLAVIFMQLGEFHDNPVLRALSLACAVVKSELQLAL